MTNLEDLELRLRGNIHEITAAAEEAADLIAQLRKLEPVAYGRMNDEGLDIDMLFFNMQECGNYLDDEDDDRESMAVYTLKGIEMTRYTYTVNMTNFNPYTERFCSLDFV